MSPLLSLVASLVSVPDTSTTGLCADATQCCDTAHASGVIVGTGKSSSSTSNRRSRKEARPSSGSAWSTAILSNSDARDDLVSLKNVGRGVALELCTAADHEFFLSQREYPSRCTSSVVLAVLWEQLSRASEDESFRCIAEEVRRDPTPSITFSIELVRNNDAQRFGLGCRDIAGSDVVGEVLMVTGISRGSCIEQWNDECARQRSPWKRLLLCCVLLSVNGVSGDCSQMRKELAASTHVVIVACNPPSLQECLLMLESFRQLGPVPRDAIFWSPQAVGSKPTQADHVFV